MKVTLKDIAKETGYSISTVSRVLSDSENISRKTRDEVLSAAKRLNYPFSGFKSINHDGENLNMALITDFWEGEFYASYFSGYSATALSEKVRLSLLSIADPRNQLNSFLTELIRENYYDGFILFLPDLERNNYQLLLEIIPEHYPVVSNAMIENPVFSTITFDGYSGGHQAANLFYDHGYRNVGIVKGPPEKADGRFRYNGFRDFIYNKKDMYLIWECEGDFTFDSGYRAYDLLKQSGMKPEAVFISNDLMAAGFIENAKSNNVHIPGDIAVLGYDDLPMSRHSKPAISSIRTDFEQLATATLRIIKYQKQQKAFQRGIMSLIPVSISERDSTGVLKSDSA
ncbi:MAG: LacI family transcriptional regulator [Balneolaceae bacterium]|nr:MAG: LacI family transcriptional regulator [Balneolaceae bacterium]